MTRTTLDAALPQLATDLQRRVARHLDERPGFSSTDRLMSELFPVGGRRQINRAAARLDSMRRQATRRQLSSALRRLQAIGYIRYDHEHGGWQR